MKTNNTFTDEEMAAQILGVVANHKKVTTCMKTNNTFTDEEMAAQILGVVANHKKVTTCMKTNNTFTDEEMAAQILGVVANHKKVTVDSVKSITNFSEKFIEDTLNSLVEDGTLKRSGTIIVDGLVKRLTTVRSKKMFTEQEIIFNE
jgi:uncharacterized HAD superfamily protein